MTACHSLAVAGDFVVALILTTGEAPVSLAGVWRARLWHGQETHERLVWVRVISSAWNIAVVYRGAGGCYGFWVQYARDPA